MDLTDEQWDVLQPLIVEPPRRADGRGRPRRNPREVLDGILWILRTGAQWADLPDRYPPYQALLKAEADALCGARRYERMGARMDTRAGHYERKLQTRAGQLSLKMPKLRSLPFETAIIERQRRREASVEESLMEMYLAG